MSKLFYVLEILGGIETQLHGPYKTNAKREKEAKAVHSKQDPECDATCWLTVDHSKQKVVVGSYTGLFFGKD